MVTVETEAGTIVFPDYKIEAINSRIDIDFKLKVIRIVEEIITSVKHNEIIQVELNILSDIWDIIREASPRLAKELHKMRIEIIDILNLFKHMILSWVHSDILYDIIESKTLYDYRDKEYISEYGYISINDEVIDRIADFIIFCILIPSVKGEYNRNTLIQKLVTDGIEKTVEEYRAKYEEAFKKIIVEREKSVTLSKEEIKQILLEELKKNALSLSEIVEEYGISVYTAREVLREIGAVYIPEINGYVVITGDDVITVYEKVVNKLKETGEYKLSVDRMINVISELGYSKDMASAYIIKMKELNLIEEKEGLITIPELRKEFLEKQQEKKKKSKKEESEIEQIRKEVEEFVETEAEIIVSEHDVKRAVERLKLIAKTTNKKEFVIVVKKLLAKIYEKDPEFFGELMTYIEDKYGTTDVAVLYNKLKQE